MLANIYASILNLLGNFQIFVFSIKFFMTFEKYPINRECLLMGYKQAISFDWINFKFSIQWESKTSESILSSGHSIFWSFCLLAILACTNWCFFAKNRQI